MELEIIYSKKMKKYQECLIESLKIYGLEPKDLVEIKNVKSQLNAALDKIEYLTKVLEDLKMVVANIDVKAVRESRNQQDYQALYDEMMTGIEKGGNDK